MNITRKVKLQLLAFATVGTVALLIVAISYPGDSRDAGHQGRLHGDAQSGGQRWSVQEFERHLSGVTVGRVDEVRLTRTASRPP